MAKKNLGKIPFPPLRIIVTDDPLTEEEVKKILAGDRSVSLCVRSVSGHAKRGGYFFHIRKKIGQDECFEVLNFEKISVLSLSMKQVIAFINHCAGLAFSEDMFKICQTVVNFRLDPEQLEEHLAVPPRAE